MFNLIVKFQPWADGRDSIPLGRALEYTEDSLKFRYQPKGELDLEAIRQLPTLFVQETSREGSQLARSGSITRARIENRNIILDYVFDTGVRAVPNSALQAFALDLDIREIQFSRTHWAVKDADLYRALLRNSQPARQRPNVFQLAEFESIEPSLMSAMMPFSPAFDAVYRCLKRTAEKIGLRCRRADDIWESPAVMQDVVSLIDKSRVVICDCSGRNPNVFYEIGIAHALGREVILITQAEADIPFDLRHLRYVPYLNNRQGLNELGKRVLMRLTELVPEGIDGRPLISVGRGVDSKAQAEVVHCLPNNGLWRTPTLLKAEHLEYIFV
jgi:hypothetical protein